MTLTRYHFAHWADLTANGWFVGDPTFLAQQALYMPTKYQQLSFNIALGQRWSNVIVAIINSLDKLDFPYFVLFLVTIYSISRSKMKFLKHVCKLIPTHTNTQRCYLSIPELLLN